MRGVGGGRRRSPGARPLKGARQVPAARTPDAALGRGMRGLVGPARSRGRTLRLPRIGRIVTPGRAGGLLGMLAAGFLYTFVTGPSAFALTATQLPEPRWTEREAVEAALALEALPAVAAAEVRVELPEAAVVVTIEEREAILAWEAGETRYLADRSGVLFAAVPNDAALPPGVIVVQDRRLDATSRFAVGDRLDAVDLDVATRLGSLTPADVGSAASRLRVRVTEADGFVVHVDQGWVAVFGFYSPATRPTDMIPGQVRLLRSLLAGREESLARVILASETDGTFIPRRTPGPTPR